MSSSREMMAVYGENVAHGAALKVELMALLDLGEKATGEHMIRISGDRLLTRSDATELARAIDRAVSVVGLRRGEGSS